MRVMMRQLNNENPIKIGENQAFNIINIMRK